MPATNPLLNRAKVLFYGLCTASGVVAPALANAIGGDLTPEKLALGLGVGVLGMLGSWRMSAEVQEATDKERERLPETDTLLRNHDLNILLIEALKRAIDLAAADSPLHPHKRLIESLPAEIEGY